MKQYIIFLIYSLTVIKCDINIVEEDNVLILTDSNFHGVVGKSVPVFVEFYAPWCGHCKSLGPEYSTAAKEFKDKKSLVLFAKVDATVEKELSSKYEIRSYPTLKLFKGDKILNFEGGRTANSIVSWVNRKISSPTIILKSIEETKYFIESNNIAVVGFFTSLSSPFIAVFETVAEAKDDVYFGITINKTIFHEYKVTKDEHIVLFKKFDERRIDFNYQLVEKDISAFVDKYLLPLVVEFKQETINKIFGGTIKTYVFAFYSGISEESSVFKTHLKESAKRFLGKMIFVFINSDEKDNKRFLDMFGVMYSETPTFRMIKMGDETIKYKPENNSISMENVNSFVQDVLDGKVKPFMKSEDIPEQWDKDPVKILVGKSFNNVARDTAKSVFVEFYAPWCVYCQRLEPIWNKLGEAYRDSPDIVIAKIDGTVNEVDGIKITSFPTIKYFPKNSDVAVDYKGKRDLESFKEFLDNYDKNKEILSSKEALKKDDNSSKDEL